MQLDTQKNRIFGIDNEMFFYLFFKTYNDRGKMINYRTITHQGYDVTSLNDMDYEYDSLDRIIKVTTKDIDNRYYPQSRMLYSQSIRTTIEEYVYNFNNQKTEYYYTVENTRETRYSKTRKKPKIKSISVDCNGCQSRHLHEKMEYDSLSNLTEEILLTEDNLIDTKSNYFYDNQNRLIKQSFFRPTPPEETIITYEYTDSGKIIHFPRSTYYYNNEDKFVKYCRDTSEKYCTEYFYENNKLIKKIETGIYGDFYVTTYYYNEKGFLRETQEKTNNEITKYIRYYYE
jgi:hypothetical protein